MTDQVIEKDQYISEKDRRVNWWLKGPRGEGKYVGPNILELKKDADYDHKTGLFNEKSFYEVAEKIMGLAKRKGEETFVIFWDIDSFKLVNDELSYDDGDKVLIALSSVLKELRQEDIVARKGGDEFVGLFVTSSEGAKVIVERVDEEFEKQPAIENIRNNDKFPIDVTLSWGIEKVNLNDTNNLRETLETSVHLASEKMKTYKHARKKER